jgi:hypothetical protein
MNNDGDKHTGAPFDSFLEEQEMLEEVEAVALKRVLAWQVENTTKKQRIPKLHRGKQ